jgi:hypothetical protein
MTAKTDFLLSKRIIKDNSDLVYMLTYGNILV